MKRPYLETHFTNDNATLWLEKERTQGLEGARRGERLPIWKNEWDWATWGREFKEAYDDKINVYKAQVIT